MITDQQLDWHKSSHSGGEGADCVEVAHTPVTTRVRDSKNRCGSQLAFHAHPWHTFLRHLKP
ncbi:DUF397 domain-containing protein [Streptomyces sp. NPDC050560]|uniref:DUF397 domain-containing protein n=1 Tax=Streptomyces sp. NPDC050560 TaxID=3365630 RepID=UPI0037900D01